MKGHRKKYIAGASFLYFFVVFGYSRQWFFRDWVLNRKDIMDDIAPWLLTLCLSILVTLFLLYLLSQPEIKQKITSLIQWIKNPSPARWIFWIIFGAVAVKTAWFYLQQLAMGTDFFYTKTHISNTINLHIAMAKQLIDGEGFSWKGQAIAMRPPGYAFVESVLFSLFGLKSLISVLLFNNFFGILIVLCAYKIGKFLFNETVGRLASLLSVFSWHELFFSNFIAEDFLFACLFVLTSYFIITKRNSYYLGLGIGVFSFIWVTFVLGYFTPASVLGLSVLLILALLGRFLPHWRQMIGIGLLIAVTNYVRPPMVLIPFALPIVYKLQGLPLKTAIRNSLVVFVVMMAAMSPWILRNSISYGQLTFLSANGGYTFFEDNCHLCKKNAETERLKGLINNELPGIYFTVTKEQYKDRKIEVNQGASDRELWLYTLGCIFQNPIGYLKTLGKRTVQLLLNADQVLLNDFAKEHLHRPRVWEGYLIAQLLNVIFYAIILLLFGAGVFHALFQGRGNSLTGLILLSYYLAMMLFVFAPLVRYRLPIWTFIYVYAAFGFLSLCFSSEFSKEASRPS